MTLRALDVTWTRSGKVVLDGVTVEPDAGSVLGLLGPNGSGKSSLLRLLAGLDHPDSGRVELHGQPIRAIRRREVAVASRWSANMPTPISTFMSRTWSGWAGCPTAGRSAPTRCGRCGHRCTRGDRVDRHGRPLVAHPVRR